jgi:hypothetical protein
MKSVISATILCLAIGAGAAFAQAPATPAAPVAPATAPAATDAPPVKPKATRSRKPKLSAEERKAISKECSRQANAKNLHGPDRRPFRAGCIKRGGKPE